MPLYDMCCTDCGARHEVRVDYHMRAGLELICMQCGGVMRPEPASPNVAVFISSEQTRQTARKAPNRATKTCGHTHHCRCAIKLDKPNPFQKQIDAALGISDEE